MSGFSDLGLETRWLQFGLDLVLLCQPICWSALAPTPDQLQLGAKEAIISMKRLLHYYFYGGICG